MAVPVRRVRKLALRAPREELVRRGVLLLEDALHTASLPDPGGGCSSSARWTWVPFAARRARRVSP